MAILLVLRRNNGVYSLLMNSRKINLTRRQFLKLIGLGTCAAMLQRIPLSKVLANTNVPKLGRVARRDWPVFEEPNIKSRRKYGLNLDQVIPILETIVLTNDIGHSETWYRLAEDEFVSGALIQLVENRRNVSNAPIPEQGSLGEITVPAIDVYFQPRGQKTSQRYYYGSTYWVKKRVLDEFGVPWYELPDDVNGVLYYVRAYAVHLVEPEEIAPLSPEVPAEQKRILVNLRDQRAIAFENEREVFSTLISSGLPGMFTPIGTFMTFHKRPSRRMFLFAGDPKMDYDFPGVPWVNYITQDGVAIHGAYWHANWGNPMTHGCISMPTEDAKWIYRWTTPVVPFGETYHIADTGTRVDVIIG